MLRVFQTRDHLSVMSGVTPEGQLATLTRPYALSGCESIRFLRHLAQCFSRRLLVIWDGSMIHRSNEVRDFLAAGGGRRSTWKGSRLTPRNLTLMKVSGSISSMSNCAMSVVLTWLIWILSWIWRSGGSAGGQS